MKFLWLRGFFWLEPFVPLVRYFRQPEPWDYQRSKSFLGNRFRNQLGLRSYLSPCANQFCSISIFTDVPRSSFSTTNQLHRKWLLAPFLEKFYSQIFFFAFIQSPGQNFENSSRFQRKQWLLEVKRYFIRNISYSYDSETLINCI